MRILRSQYFKKKSSYEFQFFFFLKFNQCKANIDTNEIQIVLNLVTKETLSLSIFCVKTERVETVQDFLIKLGIKPLIHLLEISIFLLNNDLVRLTKIMNNLVKDFKILSFKVIFQCLKLVESFQKSTYFK